jgi:hypothetical protein
MGTMTISVAFSKTCQTLQQSLFNSPQYLFLKASWNFWVKEENFKIVIRILNTYYI